MFKRFSVNGLRRSRARVLACDTSESSRNGVTERGRKMGKDMTTDRAKARVVAWVLATTLAWLEVIDVTANPGVSLRSTPG